MGFSGMSAYDPYASFDQQALDERMLRLERRLPASLAKAVSWIRRPAPKAVRLPLGAVLVCGGAVGFLPIVGYWMLPVGLVILARDVPRLRPPLVRFFDWIETKLPAENRDKPN
jgi:hypothetical protein